jgi:hypothetical protein
MQITSMLVVPETWLAFKRLAESEGTTASAMMRQLTLREVRRAQKDGRLPAAEPPAKTSKRK